MEHLIKYKSVNLSDYYPMGSLLIKGLPVDIRIDTFKSYQTYDIEPCLFFKNGYSETINKYLPLTLDDEPIIPIKHKLKIYRKDFYNLCDFIKLNKKLLLDLANDVIVYDDIIKLFQTTINEHKSLIVEMPVLKKNQSGLPLNIWIDDNQTYKNSGHWKRIKIESPIGSNNTTEWVSLLLHNLELDKKAVNDIPENLINKIRTFVLYNKNNINDVIDKKKSYNEFLSDMITFDKKGNPIYPQKEPEYYKYKNANFNYEMVINKHGKFNFIDNKDNNKLLSDNWFDTAGVFKNYKTGILAYVEIDNDSYLLNRNGKLIDITY